MQPVDYTTLVAICGQLKQHWLPARVEQVYQRDRHCLSLGLRTLGSRGWLDLAWHPVAARLNLGTPPPRTPDTFTFSDQLRHQLGGLALTGLTLVAPWERVVDLQFAKRPQEQPLWHLYLEIMGKYSNLILTDASGQIVTLAHQVNESQSSVRTLKTGQPYQLPPPLTSTIPKLEESFDTWQERVSLIPGTISQQLLKNYRGLSPTLTSLMVEVAGLNPQQLNTSLTSRDWQNLFEQWQTWLQRLTQEQFITGWTAKGYTVTGWGITQPVSDLQTLIDSYYTDKLQQQTFQQLHQQLQQKIRNSLAKLRLKAATFQERLTQSQTADQYRAWGDLLMAHLHCCQPGMTSITLLDFETNQPVSLPLHPEKNPVQNAQGFYKLHQKLKRANQAVQPLLTEVEAEITYLEQIEANLFQLDRYQSHEDLQALTEIKEELIQQKYWDSKDYRGLNNKEEYKPYRYLTPSGFELWIGRNNRQNDYLSFRLASDYDLWFHTQEIPGSHLLLRLPPGATPEPEDLQFTADLAAYYSRGRESDQVPVVYTEPKYLYKPKGAKPGMVIYRQERILWGRPQLAKEYSQQ